MQQQLLSITRLLPPTPVETIPPRKFKFTCNRLALWEGFNSGWRQPIKTIDFEFTPRLKMHKRRVKSEFQNCLKIQEIEDSIKIKQQLLEDLYTPKMAIAPKIERPVTAAPKVYYVTPPKKQELPQAPQSVKRIKTQPSQPSRRRKSAAIQPQIPQGLSIGRMQLTQREERPKPIVRPHSEHQPKKTFIGNQNTQRLKQSLQLAKWDYSDSSINDQYI